MTRPADSTLKSFSAWCRQHGLELHTDSEDLSKRSSFRIGGRALLYIPVKNEEQLSAIYAFDEINSLAPRLIGGGSNLLISSAGYPGLVLQLGDEFTLVEEKSEGRFTIGAAARSALTAKRISKAGYSGLEFLSTIPGQTGGAVIQNAGCYGGELFDLIDTVRFFDPATGSIGEKKADDIEYGYRHTEFLGSQRIVLSITLKPFQNRAAVPAEGQTPGKDYQQIIDRLDDFHNRRRSSQPANKKSAGSIFKNPNGHDWRAWQFIDACGLRGEKRGGAMISLEHANFIVNAGGAASEDVYRLIRLCEEKVYEKFELRLQREVELIGDFHE